MRKDKNQINSLKSVIKITRLKYTANGLNISTQYYTISSFFKKLINAQISALFSS